MIAKVKFADRGLKISQKLQKEDCELVAFWNCRILAVQKDYFDLKMRISAI